VPGAATRNAGPVSDPVREIRLELRLDGDSPAGFAKVCGGRPREFAGWIGLVTAIETILTGDRSPGAATTTNFTTTEGDPRDGSTPQL
jgi:hypothetical protein